MVIERCETDRLGEEWKMKRAMLAFKVTCSELEYVVGTWLASVDGDGESNAQHDSYAVLKVQLLLCDI